MAVGLQTEKDLEDERRGRAKSAGDVGTGTSTSDVTTMLVS